MHTHRKTERNPQIFASTLVFGLLERALTEDNQTDVIWRLSLDSRSERMHRKKNRTARVVRLRPIKMLLPT